MVLPQSNVLDFVDFSWEALHFVEWMGDGVGGCWREQEEGRQWELGLLCKILKDSFFQINKEKKENLLFSSYRNKASGIQRKASYLLPKTQHV